MFIIFGKSFTLLIVYFPFLFECGPSDLMASGSALRTTIVDQAMLLPSRWSRTSIRTILHHSILIINLIDGSNSNKSSNFLILFYFFCYCLSTKYPIREQDAECHFFAIKVSPNLFDSHFTLSGEDISQIVILQALKLFLS